MDMLEVLTGAGLAAAAGLNAYIPLLLLGVAARLDWIQLPEAWLWIENVWVLVIFGVLFLIELVADKVPAVDTINDWLQTVVRPSSAVSSSPVGWAQKLSRSRIQARFFHRCVGANRYRRRACSAREPRKVTYPPAREHCKRGACCPGAQHRRRCHEHCACDPRPHRAGACDPRPHRIALGMYRALPAYATQEGRTSSCYREFRYSPRLKTPR